MSATDDMWVSLGDAWRSVVDEKPRVFWSGDDPLGAVEPVTGRPLWIATMEGARWGKCQTKYRLGDRTTSVPEPPTVWRFPRLLRAVGLPEHHGYGRPRRIDVDRELVLFAAWAFDVARVAGPSLATAMYADDAESHHVSEAELKRVRRAAQDGRTLYRADGLLPWAAYPAGPPPPRWWTDHAFLDAVRDWQLEALEKPSDEPQPDPERERKEIMARYLGIDKAFQSILGKTIFGKPDPRTVERMKSVRRSLRDRQLGEAGIEPWSFGQQHE